MNGRIKLEETPEGRLAAVVESVNRQFREHHEKNGSGPTEPDYADYRDALLPWYRREEVATKLEVVSKILKMHAGSIENYMRQLTVELQEINKSLPDEYKL